MPELKVNFKNLGPIRLMPLDTSSLFLPFGRPIADYLRGVVGKQNGTRALLRQGAIDFSPLIRWTESTAWTLRTTGFGELEREGIVERIVSSGPPDPAVADFLPMTPVLPPAQDASKAKISGAVAPEGRTISKPRISALPLRPRMTFGPPPASKTKPVPIPGPTAAPTPVPPPKPVVTPIAAKPAAAIVTPPPKPGPVLAPKPVTPVKVSAPTPAPPKPAAVIPPAPKPSGASTPAPAPRMAPPQPPAATVPAPAVKVPDAPSAPPAPKPMAAPVSPKVNIPAPPASRAPEPSPAPALKPTTAPAPPQPAAQPPIQAKPGPVSAPPPRLPAPPPARAPEVTVSPIAASSPAPATVTAVRPVTAPVAPRPAAALVSAGRAPLAPPVEVISRVEAPKPAEPPPYQPSSIERAAAMAAEPHLTLGDQRPESLLERIPMALKIGVVLLALMAAIYFVFGRSKSSEDGAAAVAVGEQGWSTEQVSDVVGSRHGRQLTIYRPSVGMSDYQLQFSAQIETKAIGWFFRETDTQNYYAMKIENLAPGKMAITHFAVIEGRESGYSQRPLGVDARPGATYRVTMDVTGPRFTAYVAGEPVDFWTDNRLKSGALGFMSERDERGATSAVRFSFPHGGK